MWTSVKHVLEKWLQDYLLRRYKSVVVFRDKHVFDTIRQIKKEGTICQAYEEAYSLCMALKSVEAILGDVAEIGAYRGGSAKLLLKTMNGKKRMYVFDTFNGLPTLSELDTDDDLGPGYFTESVEVVRAYLSEYPNVHVYPGIFPSQTSKFIKNNKFSFVHLDVDLYQGTLDCLRFFYSRINRGGIIMVHDYVNIQGVQQAVQKFFRKKPEIINTFCGTHCMIIKQ